jgi:hypothetical protein
MSLDHGDSCTETSEYANRENNVKFYIGLIIAAVLTGILAVVWYSSADFNHPAPLPAGAFLVSVRACDVETAQVLTFQVSTPLNGSNVPIQQVAFHDYTVSTFCQWVDSTTRTFTVEAKGYIPRQYTVTGKKDIIAVLHPRD